MKGRNSQALLQKVPSKVPRVFHETRENRTADLKDPQRAPPVLRGIQHAHDRDAF
jgi:hypothetical protein